MKAKLEKLISLHEGYRQFYYRDTVGKYTIGIGRNLDDRGISRDEAEYMMRNDIKLCCAELDANISWWRDLDEVRQAVLIDMCFNLGWPRLAKFVKTLDYIESGDYEAASDEMLDSRWANQVKTRAYRLSKMMATGLWPNED